VQIPINIDNVKNIASLNLRINYDQSILTLQNVTNAALTSSFGIAYHVGAGYVDIVLCSDSQLVSGSGPILYLNCIVKPGAVIGSMTDLTISNLGLANQFGADIGLNSGIGVSNGGTTVILTDLEVLSVQEQGANGFKMEWPTVTNRVYTIEYSTNILQGFAPLATNIAGTGAHWFFTDQASVADRARFYRIRAR
jgi:hypothetical protein